MRSVHFEIKAIYQLRLGSLLLCSTQRKVLKPTANGLPSNLGHLDCQLYNEVGIGATRRYAPCCSAGLKWRNESASSSKLNVKYATRHVTLVWSCRKLAALKRAGNKPV